MANYQTSQTRVQYLSYDYYPGCRRGARLVSKRRGALSEALQRLSYLEEQASDETRGAGKNFYVWEILATYRLKRLLQALFVRSLMSSTARPERRSNNKILDDAGSQVR
jgi:hypothetical protein